MSCRDLFPFSVLICAGIVLLASCADNHRESSAQNVESLGMDALDVELRVMDQTRDAYDVRQGALRVACSPLPAPARLDEFFVSKVDNNRLLARAALRDPSVIAGKSKAAFDYCVSRFKLLPEPMSASVFMDVIAFNVSAMTPETKRDLLPYAGVYMNVTTVVAQDIRSGEAITVQRRAMRLIERLASPERVIPNDTKTDGQSAVDSVNAFLDRSFGDRVVHLRSTAQWNAP